MARKKAPPAQPRPTRDRVHQAFSRGELREACSAARDLYAAEATSENLALFKQTVAACAAFQADRESTEFNKLMDEADRIDSANAEWAVERACLLARGGRLADALIRVDDASRHRVLGHAADRALRDQSKDFLPDELHAGFDAILAAFRAYEAGKDDEARDALETIGLRSPFLEWKLLLRGLMAHAASEDARAIDNFARLDPQRLPSRLAAPYRAAIDASWKATVPAPTSAELRKQYEKLNSSGMQDQLREVAKNLGRDRPMHPAFRATEGVLPRLKRQAPQLVAALSDCFYHALVRQGAPDDLARYRKLFGCPADDPHCWRLQARIAEEIGEPEVANQNWKRYDDWLATASAGWTAPLLRRARAMVWHRMGANAVTAREDAEDEAPPRQRKLFEPPAGLSPRECFRKATELAPEWETASREYYGELVDAGENEEAERVARAALAHHPNSIEPLLALADLMRKQHRWVESLAFLKQAGAINPLDKHVGRMAAYGVVALARSRVVERKPDEAEGFLEADRALLDEFIPAHRDVLRAVIATMRGDRDEAAKLTEAALNMPLMRLATRYRIAVDSLLAKLKPAARKAAGQAFADALRTAPAPLEVVNLLVAFDLYRDEGYTYRGQKSQEKKFLALVGETTSSDAPESDFEFLARILIDKQQDKIARKFLASCITRFRRNPAFLLMQAELGFEMGDSYYLLESRLNQARDLAEKSKDPRHRNLVPRIDELLGQLPSPLAFLDAFFDRKF